MALFVVFVVAVVVGQTWIEWREVRQKWSLPAWASGVALGGVLATLLTAATSLASAWYQESVGNGSSLASNLFWPQLGFLLCAMGIVILSVRKKRLRMLLLLAGLLVVAFCLGFALSA